MSDEIFGFNLPHRKTEEILKVFAEAQRHPSPCCNAPSIEVYALQRPTGPTGIYKCSYCNAWFDPCLPEIEP